MDVYYVEIPAANTAACNEEHQIYAIESKPRGGDGNGNGDVVVVALSGKLVKYSPQSGEIETFCRARVIVR
jgi:hypothetical protein